MKIKESQTTSVEEHSELTPFELAQHNAFSFTATAVFLSNFTELVEEYQAVKAVLEDLEECQHESEELAEIYAISKRVLQDQIDDMEKNFISACKAWSEKFDINA